MDFVVVCRFVGLQFNSSIDYFALDIFFADWSDAHFEIEAQQIVPAESHNQNHNSVGVHSGFEKPHDGVHAVSNLVLNETAKRAGFPNQNDSATVRTTTKTSSGSFAGWEFWDERYSAPPSMLSKQTCGHLCHGESRLSALLPASHPPNRRLFAARASLDAPSCAVVSSSRVLDSHALGAEIDSHDVVMRFNMKDHFSKQPMNPAQYGSKTTHMVVHCGFWSGAEPQYKKLYLIRDRPENIILFYARMHHKVKRGRIPDAFLKKDLFPKYTAFLNERKNRLNKTFIMDHLFLIRSRAAYEAGSGKKLRFYPSSGFTGLFLMSRTCARITAYGFSDANLRKDYKWFQKWSGSTHDFPGEHHAMHRWAQHPNPTVPLTLRP